MVNVGSSSFAALLLLTRLLLASPFLYSGVDKLLRWSEAQREVAASGLPFATSLHLLTVLLQLGASVSLILGIEARFGALALCLFLVPVTLLYHPFWRSTGASRVAEADHFLSNAAIIGGLMLIALCGPGSFSIYDAPLIRDTAAHSTGNSG